MFSLSKKDFDTKVPALNLGNLKHVKEYTVQETVTMTSEELRKAEAARKQKKPPQQPPQNFDNRGNQWYHYSTKLELNIKVLRAQIV